MSERTAQDVGEGRAAVGDQGSLATWRTRPDPFATVWDTEVVPLLEHDEKGVLEGDDDPRGAPRTLPRRGSRRARCARSSGGSATGERSTARTRRSSSSRRTSPVARRRSTSRMRPSSASRYAAAARAPAVRVRAELQRVDMGEPGVRRDLRGAGRRAPGRLWELGGAPEVAALRQSVGGDARAQADRRAGADPALQGSARPLRDALDADPAGRVARKRRRRAAPLPDQAGDRRGAGHSRIGRTSTRRGLPDASSARWSSAATIASSPPRSPSSGARFGRLPSQPVPELHDLSGRGSDAGARSASAARTYSVPSRLIGHEVEVRAAPRRRRGALPRPASSRRCRGCAARASTASTTAT